MKSREEQREVAWENLYDLADSMFEDMIDTLMKSDEAEYLVINTRDQIKEFIGKVWKENFGNKGVGHGTE